MIVFIVVVFPQAFPPRRQTNSPLLHLRGRCPCKTSIGPYRVRMPLSFSMAVAFSHVGLDDLFVALDLGRQPFGNLLPVIQNDDPV